MSTVSARACVPLRVSKGQTGNVNGMRATGRYSKKKPRNVRRSLFGAPRNSRRRRDTDVHPGATRADESEQQRFLFQDGGSSRPSLRDVVAFSDFVFCFFYSFIISIRSISIYRDIKITFPFSLFFFFTINISLI